MKQTAVEWLVDQLEKKGEASVNMSIGRMQISIIEEDYINLIEQAKEMERQAERMCNHTYILTSEQGHRVIKCQKCDNTQPI